MEKILYIILMCLIGLAFIVAGTGWDGSLGKTNKRN
jgi:hypothetical protein